MQYSHIAGEVSSHKSQLKAWEVDLKEFKDISTRYTDQLIKVKVIVSLFWLGANKLRLATLDVRHGEQ